VTDTAFVDDIAMLRLIRSENVGAVTARRLLERFGSAAAALDAIPKLARRGGRSARLKVASATVARAELDRLAALGGFACALGDPRYPLALAALEDAPPLLQCRGSLESLARPAVAIVGARNASANGQRFAFDLARDLAQAGCTLVSGLARGIDAAAHEGALAAAGEGVTVAVMAGGLDVPYPRQHAALAETIAMRGLLVTEMPPGTEPQARHFPRRNRIIAGLSLATVVVEAAERSGSLITARLALEQGREVLAVPGSPRDPRAAGPNRLIRDGATLVRHADDVLQSLGALRQMEMPSPGSLAMDESLPPELMEEELDEGRASVLSLLGPTAVAVDEVLRRCQISPAAVQAVLLELELAGRLERQPGGRVALVD